MMNVRRHRGTKVRNARVFTGNESRLKYRVTLLFRLLGGHNLHLRQEERGEAVPSKAPRPGKKEADNQTERFLESILPP